MTDPIPGRVIHVTTGRVRIKVDREAITEEFAREVQRALAPLPGIREVRISPLSGSIVLQYDPDEFELTRFMELARAANVLDLQGPPPDDLDFYAQLPASSTAQRIQRTFHEVDVRLAELTAGRWDMRTVVPVAFGVLAIRQLVANGVQLAAVPWYVLGWYAFDSFWKLNQDAHRSDEARVAASPAEDEP